MQPSEGSASKDPEKSKLQSKTGKVEGAEKPKEKDVEVALPEKKVKQEKPVEKAERPVEKKKIPVRFEKEEEADEDEDEGEEEDTGDKKEKKFRSGGMLGKFPLTTSMPSLKKSLGSVVIGGKTVTCMQDLNTWGFYVPKGDGELTVALAIFDSNKKFRFDDTIVWKAELQIRSAFIQALYDLNSTGASFGAANKWTLPFDTWCSVKAAKSNKKDRVALMPKKKKEAAQAIYSIFTTDKPVILDCSAAIAVAYYRALLYTIGDDDFNEREDQVVICPSGVDEVAIGPKDIMKPVPFYDEEMELFSEFSGVGDFIPGDWVYFQSFPDYDACHADTAPWAGEHTIYIGKNKYIGFGLQGLFSANEIRDKLIVEYNNGKTKGKPKTEPLEADSQSLTREWPGPDKDVRRMKNPISRSALDK